MAETDWKAEAARLLVIIEQLVERCLKAEKEAADYKADYSGAVGRCELAAKQRDECRMDNARLMAVLAAMPCSCRAYGAAPEGEALTPAVVQCDRCKAIGGDRSALNDLLDAAREEGRQAAERTAARQRESRSVRDER